MEPTTKTKMMERTPFQLSVVIAVAAAVFVTASSQQIWMHEIVYALIPSRMGSVRQDDDKKRVFSKRLCFAIHANKRYKHSWKTKKKILQ